MSEKVAKKIRRLTRHNYREYLKEIREWPFHARWRLAWWILFGDKRKV